MKKQTGCIIALIIFGCVVMALIETLFQPPYILKSAVKISVFLVLPLIVMAAMKEKDVKKIIIPDRKGLLKSVLLGAGVFVLIFGVFLATRGVFDYSGIVNSLASNQGITRDTIIWAALYISFGNSLLEEFFFRGIAFLMLSEKIPKKRAYLFSAVMFAVYHIAFIAVSFPPVLLALALAGLTVGGYIFNRLDDKNGNIYNSWFMHIFADLALMTIAYIML